METSAHIFPDIGLGFLPMVIPSPDIDLKKWAVIACDQFTADKNYWKDVEAIVGDAPSTLHCIFPEVYLSSDKARRISSIVTHMKMYMDQGILKELGPGCMYVERETAHHPVRKGIVCTIDLEQYDYTPGSSALIRATEHTILDRIPPRVEIRKDAVLEFPHILVLYSDPRHLVSTAAETIISRRSLPYTYKTSLMKGGGEVKAVHITEHPDLSVIADQFRTLLDNLDDSLLFAVGDGNHSLATAKTIWSDLKTTLTEKEQEQHPARYALVELINLYDPGLGFEPIHRVLFKTDPEKVLTTLNRLEGVEVNQVNHETVEAFRDAPSANSCIVTANGDYYRMSFHNMDNVLVIGALQKLLDEQSFPGDLDYIHGYKETLDFGMQPNTVSFLLPPIDPGVLLACVAREGVLPRKTFSLGHAEEKRYYLEGKLIKNSRG